jgi:hypothetical protein
MPKGELDPTFSRRAGKGMSWLCFALTQYARDEMGGGIMRHISREQVYQQARIYARRRGQNLSASNGRAESRRSPFVEPQELLRNYEHHYAQVIARWCIVTP